MRRQIGVALAFILLNNLHVTSQEKTPLPAGAIAQLGTHRLRSAQGIQDFVLTPDGKSLIVVLQRYKENESNVLVFDVKTGLPRKRLAIVGANRLAIAAERNRLAVDTGKAVEIWDLDKETCIRNIAYSAPAQYAYSLAISADGSQLVVCSKEKDRPLLMRWNLTTGESLPTLRPLGDWTPIVQFAPDGKSFFASRGADVHSSKFYPGAVTQYDAKSGEELNYIRADAYFITVAPDGSRFAKSAEKSVEIVDLTAAGKHATIPIVSQRFAFTPDSKQLVILVRDGSARLWDIVGNKEVHRFEGRLYTYDLPPQMSADGRLVAMMNENEHNVVAAVQIWDLATGKPLRYPNGHPSTVNGLAYSPDGKHLATCSGDTLGIYDPATGAELRRWIAHKSSIEQIAFSPDGKLLASASIDGTIAIWNPATGQERHRFVARDSVKSIAFTRDGAGLVSVSSDRAIQTWDLDKGTVVRTISAPDNMLAPTVSPTGEYVTCFGGTDRNRRGEFDGPLRWLNVRTGKVLAPLEIRPRPKGNENGRLYEGLVTWDVTFSPDGKFFANADSLETHSIRLILSDHTVRVWETASRREILRFTDLPAATPLLAFSPDNRMLAHGVGQGQGWGWGVANRALILRDLTAARGSSLAAFDEQGVKRHGEKLKDFRQITGHVGSITSLTFSPDGKFLATGGSDSVVYIWPVKDFLKPAKIADEDEDAASYWPQMADSDAGKAYRAIAQLERRPKEAVSLLRERVKATARIDEKAMMQHLRELSSSNFTLRQNAYDALAKAGEQATHLLQNALQAPADLEMKRRLEALLERLDHPLADVNQLRFYRCLTLLERIGTSEARQLLNELTQGAPAAWLTVEARYSLKRVPPN